MNWLDIVIVCLVGIGLIKGLFDGMVKQVVSLVALIIGIYLSSGVAGWLCGYLEQLAWFPPKVIVPLSFFLGFVLIVGVILLAGNILQRLISATPLSIFDHLIGGILGLVLMVLFISLLFLIIENVDKQSVLITQEIKAESRFYAMIKSCIPTFFPGDLFDFTKSIFN